MFKEGVVYRFTKPIVHKDIKYGLKKFCVVEEDTGDGLVMLAFTCQLRNTANMSVSMAQHKGFKRCRWVEKSILIGNCEVLEKW